MFVLDGYVRSLYSLSYSYYEYKVIHWMIAVDDGEDYLDFYCSFCLL